MRKPVRCIHGEYLVTSVHFHIWVDPLSLHQPPPPPLLVTQAHFHERSECRRKYNTMFCLKLFKKNTLILMLCKKSLQDNQELDEISRELSRNGVKAGASMEEKLRGLWRMYQQAEADVKAVSHSMEQVQKKQADEMKEASHVNLAFPISQNFYFKIMFMEQWNFCNQKIYILTIQTPVQKLGYLCNYQCGKVLSAQMYACTNVCMHIKFCNLLHFFISDSHSFKVACSNCDCYADCKTALNSIFLNPVIYSWYWALYPYDQRYRSWGGGGQSPPP